MGSQAHEKLVENVLVPEAVVEVVAEFEFALGAGAGAGAGHKPACVADTVELQTVGMDTDVDTAADMGHIQGIAGSIVGIVAVVDTIVPQLAAQQLRPQVEFEKLN